MINQTKANITKLRKYGYKKKFQNIEDGIKFTLKNKWIHLRKSNTEPIVRIYAEAKDQETAQDLIDKVKSFMSE